MIHTCKLYNYICGYINTCHRCKLHREKESTLKCLNFLSHTHCILVSLFFLWLQQRPPKCHYNVPHNYSSKEQCLYVISSKHNNNKCAPIHGSSKNFQRKEVVSPTKCVSTRAYNKEDYDYLAKFPLSTTKLYTNNKNEILKLNKNGMGYETSINSSIDSIATYGNQNSSMKLEFPTNDFESNHKLHNNTKVEFDSCNLNLKHKLHNTEVDLDPYNFVQLDHEVPNPKVEFDRNNILQLEHDLHKTKVVYDNRNTKQIQQKTCNIEEKLDTKNSAVQQKMHEKEVHDKLSNGFLIGSVVKKISSKCNNHNEKVNNNVSEKKPFLMYKEYDLFS